MRWMTASGVVLLCIQLAACGSLEGTITEYAARPQTIRQDNGGMLIKYALQTATLQESGQQVKFAGRCDSACTLYLSLPEEQTCVTTRATFGFHLPKAATAEASLSAQAYLMGRYPDWVKSWIEENGGLSPELMVMDYRYASKFITPCNEKEAAPRLARNRPVQIVGDAG